MDALLRPGLSPVRRARRDVVYCCVVRLKTARAKGGWRGHPAGLSGALVREGSLFAMTATDARPCVPLQTLRTQFTPRLFESVKLGLEVGDEASIIRGFPHGRALTQNFDLLADLLHGLRHLLAQRLF